MPAAIDRYEALLADLAHEFPRFRLIVKSRSRWQRAIDRALRVVTFGQMTSYLDGYQTTIGQRVYVTDDWSERDPDTRYVTLRHERVHLRQFRRYTLPGMALGYLLLPLPLGLAYVRMRCERSAYEESVRAAFEVWGRAHVEERGFRDHILAQFTGPSYGWMWPFRRALERWYDRVLATL